MAATIATQQLNSSSISRIESTPWSKLAEPSARREGSEEVTPPAYMPENACCDVESCQPPIVGVVFFILVALVGALIFALRRTRGCPVCKEEARARSCTSCMPLKPCTPCATFKPCMPLTPCTPCTSLKPCTSCTPPKPCMSCTPFKPCTSCTPPNPCPPAKPCILRNPEPPEPLVNRCGAQFVNRPPRVPSCMKTVWVAANDLPNCHAREHPDCCNHPDRSRCHCMYPLLESLPVLDLYPKPCGGQSLTDMLGMMGNRWIVTRKLKDYAPCPATTDSSLSCMKPTPESSILCFRPHN